MATVTVPKRQKLVFKFVLDDNEWALSSDYKVEKDENGIENNFVAADELEEEARKPLFSSPATAPGDAAAAAAAAVPVAAKQDELSQISTTESSFAAVSSATTGPESYAEVKSQSLPVEVSNENVENVETHTNSVADLETPPETAALPKPDILEPAEKLQQPEVETSVSDAGFNSPEKHRVPGSFPTSPFKETSRRKESSLGKKESFIARLKGLFK